MKVSTRYLIGALVLGAVASSSIAGEQDSHEVTFDAVKPFGFEPDVDGRLGGGGDGSDGHEKKQRGEDGTHAETSKRELSKFAASHCEPLRRVVQ